MTTPQTNWPGPPGAAGSSAVPTGNPSSFPGAPNAAGQQNAAAGAAGPGSGAALRPPSSMPPNAQGQPFVPPGMMPRPGAVPTHGAPYGMPSHGMWRPQVQPAAGAAPAGAAQRPAAHPQQHGVQIKCEWTEHTAPDGRKYYYSAVTRASVWQKPKAFADAELEAQAAKVIADCPWKEHTAPDGRSYFHNRSLSKSVWKIPEELAAAQAEAARLRAQIAGATATPAPASAAAAGGKTSEFMYATPEEAKAAFKAMLSHVKAPQDSKWDKISARIEAAGDPRFKALKTNGQRASCYKEWLQDQRAAAIKAEADAAEQRRAAFVEMLDSKATLLEGARYSKVEALFFEDKRFEALPDATRQSAFTEWQENRRRKAEDDERAALNAKMDRFQELLDERQENKETALTAASVWSQVEAALADESAFRDCPGPGRLRVWLKMLARLVAEQKQQWEAEDAERFRRERKNRDNFRALLKKHREQGVLKARTKWRKYRDIIRKEYEFLCMETNLSGSRPRELFADVVVDLNERFSQDAVKVKAALRAAEFTVTRDTDWTDFLAALDPPEMQERLKGVLDVNIRLVYEEMWAKENSKRSSSSDQRRALKHELARKMKKAADFVRPDMDWSEAQQLMLANGFSILNEMDPRDCEHVWQEWVQRQKDKEKDRKHKREKRDRERHRSDRRDTEADHERSHAADDDRERRRSAGDKATPDVTDADAERAIKRARHSGSPAVGGSNHDNGEKDGADRSERRDHNEKHSHATAHEKKPAPVRTGSGGDVEEGEL